MPRLDGAQRLVPRSASGSAVDAAPHGLLDQEPHADLERHQLVHEPGANSGQLRLAALVRDELRPERVDVAPQFRRQLAFLPVGAQPVAVAGLIAGQQSPAPPAVGQAGRRLSAAGGAGDDGRRDAVAGRRRVRLRAHGRHGGARCRPRPPGALAFQGEARRRSRGPVAPPGSRRPGAVRSAWCGRPCPDRAHGPARRFPRVRHDGLSSHSTPRRGVVAPCAEGRRRVVGAGFGPAWKAARCSPPVPATGASCERPPWLPRPEHPA